jgi:hypothetical protein
MNKISQPNPFRAALALLFITLSILTVVRAQAQTPTPLLQLQATNYNAASGLWTATMGPNATASGTFPTLATAVSPNGSAAVVFNGANSLALASSLPAANGYTAFAFIKPATGTGPYALFGGAAGAFEYRIYQGKQDALRQQQADLGSETTALSTSAFSLIDVTVTNMGSGGFRLNGTADGANTASTFTAAISAIGARASGTGQENFSGSICEIDIYAGVLTPTQITNIEAQLTANYITINSLVIGAATVAPANLIYAGTPVTLAAPVIGGTGSTTYQWQTDNGSSGTSFSNIGGATTTNYVLNTSSLNGTYEYHLIGTLSGGSSVTGAPVTLTVNAASAPFVTSDTAANPTVATVDGNDTFSASFSGTLPIGYQWQVSANPSGSGALNIAGATNATLVLNNLQMTNSGYYYSLRATNTVSPYVVNSSWLQLTVQPLTALVQLIATNYDPNFGVWTDSSGNGNNATYFGTGANPPLAAVVTPNGGSAINVTNGGGSFLLASTLDPSVGYTVFAFVKPSSVTGRHAITGGSAPTALEYDIYNTNQDYLSEYTLDVGHGTAAIPTTNFSLIDLAVNSSGATFRFNGTADGTAAGSTFGQPITRIGNNEGAGDGYVGLIAEVDIYSGVLSSLQVSNVEAQFTSKYVTINTLVVGPATVSPSAIVYAGTPVTLASSTIGGNANTTYQWQTDNGSGGASFSNIGGATSTNYVLNTSSLLGVYEYHLVGTPFGGSSVTGAPVTLTINSASAPFVTSDTSYSPNPASVGGNTTFLAAFDGTLPIAYQWQVSASPSGSGALNIAGATNATLVLNNLQLTNSGYYYSLRAMNTVSPYVANSSWLQLTVQPLTALVQLIATNYDPVGGVWTDASGNGNNATYFGTSNPTLVSSVTPGGASAVNIGAGDGSFLLASSLDPSSGYTVLAYVEPSSTTGRHALTGGSAATALEYDIYNGNQDYLTEYTLDVGHGTATIPTNSFSLINLAVNSSGATFRFNGAADGMVSGAMFGQPITRLGNNEGGGDGYVGQIAEIDIYSGVLSYNQITNIEAQLTVKYGSVGTATNPTNILATVVGGNLQLMWPADHTGWTLQVQTNTLNIGLSTNWTAVPNSTTTNMVTMPIVPGNSSVFYRLKH